MNPWGIEVYVSGKGSDANNGLSWETAFASVYKAWSALTPASGGVIYLTMGATWGGPVPGQGLQILGPNDPQWNNPPAGWLKEIAVRIIGVADIRFASLTFSPAVLVSGNDANHPAIWLSGTNWPLHFKNVMTEYSNGESLRMGYASSGGMTPGPTGTSKFENCHFQSSINIGAETFWVLFEECVAHGTPAVVVDPQGGASSGLLTFRNCNLAGGGIKYTPGSTGWGLVVDGLVTEAQPDGHGAVWITDANEYGYAQISNVTVADATGPSPGVEVTQGLAESVLCWNIAGNPEAVIGPARILNQYPGNLWAGTVHPRVRNQEGFFNGHIVGDVPHSRRQFSPVTVRFPNLVSYDPASYRIAGGSGGSFKPSSLPGPDGSMNASEWQCTASGAYAIYPAYVSAYPNQAVGDRVIAGAWLRSLRPGGGFLQQNGDPTIAISSLCWNNSAQVREWWRGQLNSGDGEWEWQWRMLKVLAFTAGPTPTATPLAFYYQFPISICVGYPWALCYPMFVLIPASAGMSDNEALEYAATLQSYPSAAKPGQLWTPTGMVPFTPIAEVKV